MSTEIYEGSTMYVTRFVGPASEGRDRQRWQFTPLDGDTAVLTFTELQSLYNALSLEVAERRARVWREHMESLGSLTGG